MLDFSHYKSILCLNGDLPAIEFFQHGLPIIAADGAANTLMKMGITPELVIGDLDSIEPQYAQALTLHYHHDQDYSDYQKSLLYLRTQHLLPAIVVGVNGGYLDHILNNINHFMYSDSVLFAPPIYGYTLTSNATKKFIVPLNTKISIIGMPTAEVSSQGLQWELNHYAMSFPGKNSCFNRSISETIQITVHHGQVLILIYAEE